MNQKFNRQKFNKYTSSKTSKDNNNENVDHNNMNGSKSSSILKLQTDQTIIPGKHSTLAALKNPKRYLFYLITTEDHKLFWGNELRNIGLNIELKIKKKEELDIINNFKPHQNIILVTKPLERLSLDEFLIKKKDESKFPLRLIILDQVTDPQNVGAIIRSAHAFKMDGVALSQRNSPLETAAMSKASSGAIEKLDIIELSNMAREIKKLQQLNFTVYGLANGGETSVFSLENETDNIAIILGSEGKGLRRLTKERVDRLITIPISEESESLNVSSAASVAMFQLQKNILV
ncbi:23S rRNA (guanosine(2251)-2'-O)-methyltransferase RlmB [Alphaproteobacteria bacterium]|nr:23S rRNA (guanosine(2251)-2'-O)-methyltransferase RlmB [Alphaproteobacteria bacterium]